MTNPLDVLTAKFQALIDALEERLKAFAQFSINKAMIKADEEIATDALARAIVRNDDPQRKQDYQDAIALVQGKRKDGVS